MTDNDYFTKMTHEATVTPNNNIQPCYYKTTLSWEIIC